MPPRTRPATGIPGVGAIELTNTSAAKTALGHEIKATLGRIKAEGRDPNAQEERHLRDLRHALETENDQLVADGIREWGDRVGLNSAAHRRGGSAGRWGEQVLKSLTDSLGRFKELAPSGGAPVSVPVDPDPVREGEPLTTMRQLIPAVRNTSGMFAYLRQTARENNAAAVAAGAVKPTSRYTTERIDDRVRVVAHLSEPVERQTLSDAPMLERFVDDELRLGLELEVERLVLNGSGAGEEFAGLANTSGVQVQPWTTDLLTTTRTAITKLEVLGLAPTGWVFNPVDWQRIELSANAQGYTLTQAGEQLPVQRASRLLWGLPVAVSSAQPIGTGWLADWSSTALHIREDARVDWSENIWRPDAFGAGQGASDFTRNLLAFRCECRLGFQVGRPAGVVELDLTAA